LSNHTPGPWNIEPDDERGGWFIRYYAETVAYVPPSANTDARLIAAAPDLLAALQEVVGHLWSIEDVSGHDWDGTKDLARAAIAKAKGITQSV